MCPNHANHSVNATRTITDTRRRYAYTMRIFLPIFAFILFTCSSIGAPFNQVIRTPLTTNEMMNQPQNSFIPIWNSAAAKWSNGVNTASATNNAQPPSTVLTNLSFTGALTNVNPNQFFPASATHLTITNTPKITNLWDYITARIFGDLFVSTNLHVTNKITAYGLLGIESAGGGGFAISGGGSYSSSQFAGDFALETGVGPNASIQESAITSQELSTLSGSSGNIQTNLTAILSGINNRIANMSGRGTNTTFLNITNLGVLTNAGAIITANIVSADGGLFANNPSTLSALTVNGIFTANAGLNSFAQDLTVGGPLGVNNGQMVFGVLGSGSIVKTATNASGGLQFLDPSDTPLMEFIQGDVHTYNEWFFSLPFYPLDSTWIPLQIEQNLGIGAHDTNLFEVRGTNGSFAVNGSGGLIVGALVDSRAGTGSIVATGALYAASVSVMDEVYGAGWNGSTNVPTKNAVYDKIETIVAGSGFQASSMVLSNLVGTVANNVTNENTTALQINAGVMSLTPGVLSNVVASGFGAPYIAVSTNSGANNNVTSLVFRTPSVTLSNDSAGIASIHVAASGGGGGPFNTTQFDASGSVTSIISGVRATNVNAFNLTNRGVVHYSSGLASNSFLYLGANSNVAAGTFGSGLTFSGGTVTAAAASTNNPVQAIGTMILTNGTIYKPLDLGSTTNVVLSWNTNYYVVSPSNSPTISWTDIPASTDGRKIYLKLINTNFSSAFFPTNGLNGGSVILLSSPSTNEYTLNKDTNGFWIASGQMLTTGRLDTNVFNVEPVLHSPTLTGTNTVNGNIGWVEQYPTGTGGALTNFTLLVNQAASFVINGFTNVSFRALYGGVAGLTYTFSIEITNGSVANRTLEFSQETNNWVWAYGAPAPTVLTNSERAVIEGKLRGSNITATAAYFPWP